MMAWMEMAYKMNFLIFKFDLEIFEILQKCHCNTKFLQEIAFYHFVGSF